MEAKQETEAGDVEVRANALKEEGNAALAGRFLQFLHCTFQKLAC